MRYAGLGFVLEGTPAPDRSQGSWISFVRPTAYVSPFIIEERPQEETKNIDVLLPSRMHEEEERLCSDVLPALQPPEGKDPHRPEEEKPSIEDPLDYMLQEVEIPPVKDGLPGIWCSYHQSARHNLEDCRELNDTQIRRKNG